MTDDTPITQVDLQNAVQSASLATQMAGVIKDLGRIELRMDQHEARHEREKRDRIVARRWMIGTAIAFLALIETPLLYILWQGRHH